MESAQSAPATPAVNGNWGSPQQVHMLAMLSLTLIALALCVLMTLPFLSAIAWALALTILVLPFHRLVGRSLQRPGLVATITVMATAITVVAPVFMMTSNIAGQAATAAMNLQEQLESGRLREVLAQYPYLTPFVTWGEANFDLAGVVSAASSKMTGLATDFVRGSVRQAVVLLLTFYLLFYFLRDHVLALRSIRALSPLSYPQMSMLYLRVGDALYATIYGTFAVAAVQGLLGGLMFWWLGLPAPLLWGVVMGVLAIVPVLGAFVIWVPAALFLLAIGEPGKALILGVWGTLIVGGIDNLMYPMLVGNRMHLHTVLVFISIVGGLLVFGAAGLILGPLVLTVTSVLLEIWRHPQSDAPPAELSAEAVVR